MRSVPSPHSAPAAIVVLLALLLPIVAACGTTAGTQPVPTPGPATTRPTDPPASPPALPAGTRPNVVLIVTDDLDARSLEAMPNIGALLRDGGTSFASFFASTPLCCPSRASILRGQYAHNHGVQSNTGIHGGFPAFLAGGSEDSTLATWLQDAGYRTGLLGKYLNGYPKGVDPTHVPPGWDEWAAFAPGREGEDDDEPDASYYLNYRLNENGELVSYGRRPKDYSTDVLAAKATEFVAQAAAQEQPFFLYLAPYAPHAPSIPAPRHAEEFTDASAPRPPSFDEPDIADKPAWVSGIPPLSDEQIAKIDGRYRDRLRLLLAVDDMVADLIATLEAEGTLDRTFLLFTSDNGFHLGEHRLALGKQSPYEESIRVPLLVRGPGVAAGRVVEELALNVDLAPTIAELAGVAPPAFIDGRSLAPLLRGETPAAWRQAALLELFAPVKERTRRGVTVDRAAPEEGEPEEDADPADISPSQAPPYRALRTARHLYVEYEGGERELYDLETDPFEETNLAAVADPALLAALAARLTDLTDCGAAACRAAEDAPLASGPASPPAPPALPAPAGGTALVPSGSRLTG